VAVPASAVLGPRALLRSGALLGYWLAWFAGVNLFVIGYEEPTLERQFGAEYVAYKSRVPRWIPRIPAPH
jgi:protein-S-isoprenylcysteine O-methyltransferase Ste14